jgi:hypothetical protein
MGISKMRLTREQRLEALERELIVLQDTIKILHRLLKQQRDLINDYITQNVASAAGEDEQGNGNVHPERALYTFVCSRRLDLIEKQIEKLYKIVEASGTGLKAG